MSKFIRFIFTAVGFLVIATLLISIGGFMKMFSPREQHVTEPALLQIELEGMIMDGKEFLDKLKDYRDDDRIKGVIVQINSPGGVVGPSQEIYAELKRTREEFKKPVVVSCSGLAASGAYYAAVAADKIVTNPGTLMGSIGVIMEFANLEKLYSWAHVQRYTITSGQFKDSGSEYRPMTAKEHDLFQNLISEVYGQFKNAVKVSRPKIEASVLDGYTDGRIFTGETAVKLGFADQVGTFEDAVRIAGEMAGLGKKPKLFKPSKHKDSWMDYFTSASEDSSSPISRLLSRWNPPINMSLVGQPLMVMPGSAGL